MTVTDVSPCDQYPIGAKLKGLQNETRIYATRTHHTDDPDVGRILKATNPCQVSGRIGAPITGKCNDFRIERFAHRVKLLLGIILRLPALRPPWSALPRRQNGIGMPPLWGRPQHTIHIPYKGPPEHEIE